MTSQERYDLIKSICQRNDPQDEVGELPYTECDLQDELARFSTHVEPSNPSQDSEQWETSFVQELVFGS